VRTLAVHAARNGASLGERIRVADSWWTRFRGLLGTPPLAPGEGLLIDPCRSVHMFGMRYPIDVAFLDRAGKVVGLCHRLAPGARSPWIHAARSALELPAGTLTAAGITEGDLLTLSPLETH
jgi:uncharacterized membrane protein (UPF0127 family)